MGRKEFLCDEKEKDTSMEAIYGSRAAVTEAPTERLPSNGMAASCAKQILLDEIAMDGNCAQNLATFVNTYTEREAEEIAQVGNRINWIDMDEYPQSTDIHQRCVNIIGELWHGTPGQDGRHCGTATTGSSEAIMLAVLAMKKRWKDWRASKGMSTDAKPNIVFGSNVQCCWHKACLYFEVDAREADISEDDRNLNPERALPLCDDCTIGVCPILGSTYDGSFEDVKGIHDAVQELNEKNGWDIPLHVDAASGGFVAPFTRPDSFVWDFRLPLVKSINASGHKFGLTTIGLGWLLFNKWESLPDSLVTHVNYLGGDQASLTLNFSKPATGILVQYYNFLRLGRDGYTKIMKNGLDNASYLRNLLKGTKLFDIVDKGDIPLVAFKLRDEAKAGFTLFDLQDALKARGWTLPAYRLPKAAEHVVIMRAVVKQNLTRNMAKILFNDILHAIEVLKAHAHAAAPTDTPKQKKRKADTSEAPQGGITTKIVKGNHKHIMSKHRTTGIC